MKNILSLTLCACMPFLGCSGVQVATTVSAIANTAATGYTDYVKAQTGSLTPQDVIVASTLAYNDISGIAAMAQAYSGSGLTPNQAAIAAGASAVPIAAKIVAALPNVPITQTTASNLYAAATDTANQILATNTAPGPCGEKGRSAIIGTNLSSSAKVRESRHVGTPAMDDRMKVDLKAAQNFSAKLALYREQLRTGQIDLDDYWANLSDARAVEEMREIGARP